MNLTDEHRILEDKDFKVFVRYSFPIHLTKLTFQIRLRGHVAAYVLCPNIGAYHHNVTENLSQLIRQNPGLLKLETELVDDEAFWNKFETLLADELATMRGGIAKKGIHQFAVWSFADLELSSDQGWDSEEFRYLQAHK